MHNHITSTLNTNMYFTFVEPEGPPGTERPVSSGTWTHLVGIGYLTVILWERQAQQLLPHL